MAKVYSDDLRRKLLEAHQRGEGSLPSLAARFSVSVGWAKKDSRSLLHAGQMERSPGAKRGRTSKLTEQVREHLRAWITSQADLTLAELRARLAQELALSVSVGRLWTVLGEMDLRLKKVTPRRRAGHRSRPAEACQVVGADGPDRGGTADFPGRKRRDDRNDTALRSSVGKRASARRHTGRPLENPHRSGCGGPVGLGRHNDHPSVHGRRSFPRLSGTRAVPATQGRPNRGDGQPLGT